MKIKIEKSLSQIANEKIYNLDPLNTNTKELERCYSTMFNPNIKCEGGILTVKKN